MSECPLCSIPQRETLLYRDDVCYIVNTKQPKGHKLRVMVVTNSHTDTPTPTEFAHCLDRLRWYMENNSPTDTFYLVFGTYASVPQHYHIIGCDDILDLEESKQMFSSDYVRCLIHTSARKILIGIPAHNEEKQIGDVVKEAKKFGTVLVMNNSSEDSTDIEAKKAGAIVQTHNEWKGYGHALYEIFRYAKENGYDILITLDGDGQHNPNEIPRFLTALIGSDIVIGNRFLAGERVPEHRKAVISAFNAIYRIGDTQCGFRAYNRKAMESITITDDGMGASLQILNIAKEKSLKLSEVPCAITYDEKEKPLKNLVGQGLNLINTIFWSGIWARPYTFLGIPALALILFCVWAGSQALYVYIETGRLLATLAILTGVTFLSALALITMIFFITMFRRVIAELSRK